MSNTNTDRRAIEAFIIKTVESYWNDHQRAYLLSSLGTLLKREFDDTAIFFPKGVKDFLREWPLVQLVQHPEINEKTGLIPANVPVPKDIPALFIKGKFVSPKELHVSYVQHFWNAFFQPLEKARYVSVAKDGSFDITENEPDSEKQNYEITAADIVPDDPSIPMQDKVSATRDKIKSWLSRNSLDATQFARNISRKGERLPTNNMEMLKQVFSKLSQHDQSRISIPVDIILKLMP